MRSGRDISFCYSAPSTLLGQSIVFVRKRIFEKSTILRIWESKEKEKELSLKIETLRDDLDAAKKEAGSNKSRSVQDKLIRRKQH